MVRIGRSIHGISINGLEYVLDECIAGMQFDLVESEGLTMT